MKISPSPGECLHVWRRRQGFTPQQVADRYEVCRRTINDWERDRIQGVPDVIIGGLKDYEKCYLIRRRESISTRKLALTLGVSKTQIARWEHGEQDYGRLLDFYKELGWEI